jgi:hypothetical protein
MEAARKIEFEKRPRAARVAPYLAPTKCLSCEDEAGYRTVAVTKEVELKGESIPVTYECQECQKCGHSLLSVAQMEQRVRNTVAAYQAKHGLLSAKEIASRRKALGYATQQALSDAAPAIAIATLKRVEAGQHVQDPGTDSILRMALEKLDQEKRQNHLMAFLRTELSSPIEAEATTRGNKPGVFVASAWRGAWATLPLAACFTVVASQRAPLPIGLDSIPPREVARGC